MENKKTKVLGFMTIHYSGDYLREALLSVRNQVDKMVIAYSHRPSQGHSNKTACPDSHADIYRICNEVLRDKMIWDEKEMYYSEAEHRDVKYKYAEGFDLILTVDADEIMVGIPEAIEYALSHTERHFGINGYINFFRSHSHFCSDGFRPVRIEVMGRDNQLQNLECLLVVYHFSLCQRKEIMEYKYKNFGHASEIRPNYLQDIFYKWSPTSDVEFLHPASLQIWQHAQYFNKEMLPSYLREHPNHNFDLIP
jgi:hypothetical protein